LVWIVDPIDGTRGYLAGREDWCVSVALVEDSSPVLAAVFVPASDEFFFAMRGQGAALNDVPVCAAAGTELDFSRVAGPKPLVERLSRSGMILSCIPESDHWHSGCAGSRKGASTRRLRAARAATGTLPRPI